MRRPLIDATGDFAGFEFRLPERLIARMEPAARPAYLATLLAAARLAAQSGQTGLARLPCSWLADASRIVGRDSADVWIGLEWEPDLSEAALEELPAAVQALRAQGVKVGWCPLARFAMRPDFSLWRQMYRPIQEVIERAMAAAPALPGAAIVITDIAQLSDFERAMTPGVTYVCGALSLKQSGDLTQQGPQSLPPTLPKVGRLLAQLASETPTPVVVEAIKSDVALTYNLLRRLQSPYYASYAIGSSIDRAVQMLGRKELHRCLAMMLVQCESAQRLSPALQKSALWRARLFELLAPRVQQAPELGFTLGLASTLGVLMQVAPGDVGAALGLPPEACAALTGQEASDTWWAACLRTAELLEQNASGPVMARFGGEEAVEQDSNLAWRWVVEGFGS